MDSSFYKYADLNFQDFWNEAAQKKEAIYGKKTTYHNFIKIDVNKSASLLDVNENSTFQLKMREYTFENFETLKNLMHSYHLSYNTPISVCAQMVPTQVLEQMISTRFQLQVNLQSVSKQIIEKNSSAYDEPVQKRLATIEAATRLSIPTAVKLQVGLGEEKNDVLNTLSYIKEISDHYKMIQSVIIGAENTQVKLEMLLWTLAVSRLILHDKVHITGIPTDIADIDILSRTGVDDINNIPNPQAHNLIYRDLFFNSPTDSPAATPEEHKKTNVDIDLTKSNSLNSGFQRSYKKANKG
jgi:hypothetical protein